MPDTASLNHRWARLLVEELVRCGVTQFCIAPGSRSTPLTLAAATHPAVERIVHFDERGSAFFALGYGRATGRPAAWITTSGTALANGYPAVIEASVDHVPMLLLTADRPPELRQTGANQTIHQPGLYGGYPRWQMDLPPPDATVDPVFLLTMVDQAVYRSLGPEGGPVHLNCQFREPLAPPLGGNGDEEDGEHVTSLASWREADEPYTRYVAPLLRPDETAVRALAGRLAGTRGLFVIGATSSAVDSTTVHELATRLGWPLVADVLAGVRFGADASRCRVVHADYLVGTSAFAAAHEPEAVIHIGACPTSKRLAQFLEAAGPATYVHVAAHPERVDPAHQVTHRMQADPSAWCRALAAQVDAPAPSGWLDAWRAADRKVAGALDARLQEHGGLSEPLVARLVARHLPDGHALMLGNSMPVRDADLFAEPGTHAPFVTANRGASGIDGLVATAAGVAYGRGAPATLLIGDLSLLHDLNSLALLRSVPVVVVVVNNDGGGIFHFLPIADHETVFEPYFGTPHGLTFRSAAEMMRLPYAQPATPGAFVEAYTPACASGRSAVIEVRTERGANRDVHAALRDAAGAAIESVRRG